MNRINPLDHRFGGAHGVSHILRCVAFPKGVLTPFHIHLGFVTSFSLAVFVGIDGKIRNRLRMYGHTARKIIVLKLKQCLIKKYSMLHKKRTP